MDRRSFLHFRNLARSAGQVLGALDEVQDVAAGIAAHAEVAPECALLRFSRPAMATTFEVVVPYGTPDALASAESALDEIDRLEEQLTVYRDTSEVSYINQRAEVEPIKVEARLFGLLLQAQRISRETEGAFDISTGALIKAWGFFKRCARLPSDAERREVLERVGMRHVVLDTGEQTVRYLRQGLEINLGSIGKGYALDRVVELVRAEGKMSAALLHGGHSSVYAMGNEPGSRRGWGVAIRHPWEPERRLALVRLRGRGLATSAATFQHLEHNGRKLGHLLDPRIGWPAEGIASATVLAPTAAEADALATAFFILGVEKARAYCETHPGIGAVMLPDGEVAAPVFLGTAPDEID